MEKAVQMVALLNLWRACGEGVTPSVPILAYPAGLGAKLLEHIRGVLLVLGVDRKVSL